MDKLQISQIIKELVSQGYPEPIIGGTCSLFLQGFDIEPGDIDLYYTISKKDFLNQIHYKRCPKFPISIDWNFYPNLDLGFQEIEIEGVKLRVQEIEDVLNYKLEGLEEDYFPESKRDKHLRFFQKLISDPRVSTELKLRINRILNIMPRDIKDFSKSLDFIKEQLFDAPAEIKQAFNKIVEFSYHYDSDFLLHLPGKYWLVEDLHTHKKTSSDDVILSGKLNNNKPIHIGDTIGDSSQKQWLKVLQGPFKTRQEVLNKIYGTKSY